jgi:DNA polymerase III subunit gamma/tau
MSYQVIARQWRPQTFSDLVGQTHVTATLANAIKNNRVAHAYIFSGARGVGKTTAARILAKALNCVNGPTAEPCGVCDSCKEIAAGTSLDVIEIDAASNRGIDQIRELREMVRYAPAASRSKVVILDEAHMLTGEASNALLKTLEEPPDRVVFVMATTQPEDLEDTIRSRSQHFHFRALTFAEITGRIEEIAAKEGLNIQPGALAVIARMAEGSLRDALSLLEQARAYCGDVIPDKEVRELLGVVPEDSLNELVSAIAEGSADRALGLVHTFQKEGRNLQHFCREAIRHIRNLLIARVCGADSDLIAATADQRPALAKAAGQFSEEELTRFFQILLQTDDDLRRKPDARVHLEMGLLRLINAQRLAPMEELLAELRSGAAAGAAGSGATRSSGFAAPALSAPQAAPVRGFSPAPQTNFAPIGAQRARPFEAQGEQASPQQTARPAAAHFSATVGATAVAAAQARAEMKAAATMESATTGPQATIIAAGNDETKNLVADAEFPVPVAEQVADSAESATSAPEPATESAAETRADGITHEQVAEIKETIQAQQKFLGEIVEQGSRWELEGAELRIYFSTDKRAFADMMEGRDSLEKVRACSSKVLGRPVRVCAKVEAASTAPHGISRTQELRAQFEKDPMVRSMLRRFGGRISEVKWRQEGS